jgi:phytanoyl-CoA hydroxylase
MITISTLNAWRDDVQRRGFFIARGLVDRPTIAAIKQGLLDRLDELDRQGTTDGDKIYEPSAGSDPKQVPLHERFRKLNGLADIEAAWNGWYANPRVMELVNAFIGPDALTKYTAAFLKPARVGGSTPWHQDIGLWQDHNDDALNAWMAIDAATVENGCLQVVPGSHLPPVTPHVTYPDSVHPEIPRELCTDLTIEQVELEPGDAIFWHPRLWHYSPPNRSHRDRMGVGATWVSPAQLGQIMHNELRWASHRGQAVPFPAPSLIVRHDRRAALPAPIPAQASTAY